jgi:phosphate starvation-inducible PhoH-like protein
MTEKILNIEAIDPIELQGVNNSKLEIIKKAFPKVQLIARGHEIKVIGEELNILEFETKLKEIINFFDKFNRLSKDDILQILNATTVHKIAQENIDDLILFGNNGTPIRAITKNQKTLVQKSFVNDMIFAIGPAGSGKTYTAIALAVRALRNREVKKIILSRPAVEAGERLGFLPGDLKEKIDPYLQPLYDALHDMIPRKKLEGYIEEGIVQIAPLAFMRGRTLDNAFVILDEAQNTTMLQMKMFLTRMGMNAKFIITGDVTQIDLPRVSDSGLVKSLKILDKIEGISIVELDETDIVRHRLVKEIVKAYEKHSQ